MMKIPFPPGLCDTKRNAMDVSAQHVRHQKRERCLENHRSSQQYQYYKDRQADCEWLPPTPRPLAYENKSGWEKDIFTWRTAMNIVHLIYSWMVACACKWPCVFRRVACTDLILLQEKRYTNKIVRKKSVVKPRRANIEKLHVVRGPLGRIYIYTPTHVEKLHVVGFVRYTHTCQKQTFCCMYL